MSVRVEIGRLRLSGVPVSPGGADRLRGDLQRAIAAELAPVAIAGEPITADAVTAGIRRVVATSVERSVG